MSSSNSILLRMGDVMLGGGKEMGRGVVEHAGGLYQKGGKRREKYKEEIGECTSFTTDTIASPTSSFSICTSFHSVPSPKPMSPVVVVKVDDDSKPPDPAARSPNTLLSSTAPTQVWVQLYPHRHLQLHRQSQAAAGPSRTRRATVNSRALRACAFFTSFPHFVPHR